MTLSDHSNFSGSATDLVAAALECAAICQLRFDPDRTNERLIRYYVSEGVLDRPERVGRDAAYAYRHLLQLLSARRMAEAGVQLALIARHNQVATTQRLEDELAGPAPTAAELLVKQFMHPPTADLAKVDDLALDSPRMPAPSQSVDPAGNRRSTALPDVLAEVHQMRQGLEQTLSQLAQAIDQLTRQQEQLTRTIEQLTHRQGEQR
ncbi:MAG: hypothetical protein U1F00_13050 [Rhodoferax sp.]